MNRSSSLRSCSARTDQGQRQISSAQLANENTAAPALECTYSSQSQARTQFPEPSSILPMSTPHTTQRELSPILAHDTNSSRSQPHTPDSRPNSSFSEHSFTAGTYLRSSCEYPTLPHLPRQTDLPRQLLPNLPRQMQTKVPGQMTSIYSGTDDKHSTTAFIVARNPSALDTARDPPLEPSRAGVVESVPFQPVNPIMLGVIPMSFDAGSTVPSHPLCLSPGIDSPLQEFFTEVCLTLGSHHAWKHAENYNRFLHISSFEKPK